MKTNTAVSVDAGHIAILANLPLTKEELGVLGRQLAQTFAYISKIKDIDTKNVTPTSQVTGLENVFRDDVVVPSLSQRDALKNARRTYKGYFMVDAIFE